MPQGALLLLRNHRNATLRKREHLGERLANSLVSVDSVHRTQPVGANINCGDSAGSCILYGREQHQASVGPHTPLSFFTHERNQKGNPNFHLFAKSLFRRPSSRQAEAFGFLLQLAERVEADLAYSKIWVIPMNHRHPSYILPQVHQFKPPCWVNSHIRDSGHQLIPARCDVSGTGKSRQPSARA